MYEKGHRIEAVPLFRACVFLIGIDNAAAVCLTDNPAIICVITMSGTLFWID